jgi:hypothetical protein
MVDVGWEGISFAIDNGILDPLMGTTKIARSFLTKLLYALCRLSPHQLNRLLI